MANINITGSASNPTANNYQVPSPQANSSQVSFHSANSTVMVCFTNSATFGQSGVRVQGGQPATPLVLKAVEATGFCVCADGTDCSQNPSPCSQAGIRAVTTYNITMGSGVPGSKHSGEHKK